MSHYSKFREKAEEESRPAWQDRLTEQEFFKNNPEATRVIDDRYALRYNTDKPQLSYIDLKCFTEAARVLEFGATKYTRYNWKKGMPVSKIIDSLLRHIGDLQDGKVIDDESKLSILGHIQANAMFLGNKNNVDDMTPQGNLYTTNKDIHND